MLVPDAEARGGPRDARPVVRAAAAPGIDADADLAAGERAAERLDLRERTRRDPSARADDVGEVAEMLRRDLHLRRRDARGDHATRLPRGARVEREALAVEETQNRAARIRLHREPRFEPERRRERRD